MAKTRKINKVSQQTDQLQTDQSFSFSLPMDAAIIKFFETLPVGGLKTIPWGTIYQAVLKVTQLEKQAYLTEKKVEKRFYYLRNKSNMTLTPNKTQVLKLPKFRRTNANDTKYDQSILTRAISMTLCNASNTANFHRNRSEVVLLAVAARLRNKCEIDYEDLLTKVVAARSKEKNEMLTHRQLAQRVTYLSDSLERNIELLCAEGEIKDGEVLNFAAETIGVAADTGAEQCGPTELGSSMHTTNSSNNSGGSNGSGDGVDKSEDDTGAERECARDDGQEYDQEYEQEYDDESRDDSEVEYGDEYVEECEDSDISVVEEKMLSPIYQQRHADARYNKMNQPSTPAADVKKHWDASANLAGPVAYSTPAKTHKKGVSFSVTSKIKFIATRDKMKKKTYDLYLQSRDQLAFMIRRVNMKVFGADLLDCYSAHEDIRLSNYATFSDVNPALDDVYMRMYESSDSLEHLYPELPDDLHEYVLLCMLMAQREMDDKHSVIGYNKSLDELEEALRAFDQIAVDSGVLECAVLLESFRSLKDNYLDSLVTSIKSGETIATPAAAAEEQGHTPQDAVVPFEDQIAGPTTPQVEAQQEPQSVDDVAEDGGHDMEVVANSVHPQRLNYGFQDDEEDDVSKSIPALTTADLVMHGFDLVSAVGKKRQWLAQHQPDNPKYQKVETKANRLEQQLESCVGSVKAKLRAASRSKINNSVRKNAYAFLAVFNKL